MHPDKAYGSLGFWANFIQMVPRSHKVPNFARYKHINKQINKQRETVVNYSV